MTLITAALKLLLHNHWIIFFVLFLFLLVYDNLSVLIKVRI